MERKIDADGLPPAPNRAPESETASLQLQLTNLHELLVELLEERNPGDPLRKKTPSEAYLTRSELGRVLKVSLSTVDRLVADGMPFTWVGRHRRFELGKVRMWLDRPACMEPHLTTHPRTEPSR